MTMVLDVKPRRRELARKLTHLQSKSMDIQYRIRALVNAPDQLPDNSRELRELQRRITFKAMELVAEDAQLAYREFNVQ